MRAKKEDDRFMEQTNFHTYKKMYYALFNHISDAIAALDAKNASLARDILCAAQQEGEELYLEENPDGDETP